MSISAAVITCSDSVAAGRNRDDSGAVARRALIDLGFGVPEVVAVPDEPAAITAAVRRALSEGARIVITNGGTGPGPRDVTVSVVEGLGGALLPGIGEAMRADARTRVPTADLSRAGAYQIGPALVLCLPGSPGAVADGMRVAGPLLDHAVGMMDGGGHAAHRPDAAVVTEQPIDATALVASVADDGAGAVVTFEGRVRNSDKGREVVRLTYEAHPDAAAVLGSLVAKAAQRPKVLHAAAAHRTGELHVGDLAFIAVVSAPHRRSAFSAVSWLVDEVKAELPMWKLQAFADGTQEWVNSP